MLAITSFKLKGNIMKIDSQKIPGHNINEYMLLLRPHEELRNKIMQVKKEFFDVYKSSSSLWIKPVIPLLNFIQYGMMEERIVGRLKNFSKEYHPFKIELKDFGSLPAHTIFINVPSREPIRKLVSQIKQFQQLMKPDNDNKPYFVEEPHICIARKLSPWEYEKAWPEYANKNFSGRFLADRMLLLRKGIGDKTYQLLQEFEFENLNINASQGKLFS
jgi:2'-5' RNA ligase